MQSEAIQSSPSDCAREVLDVVPLAMRMIRNQLRKHGAREMSVPHFRTLIFLNRHGGASLSEVADHLGLTLPSMSELIDGLVNCGLATRKTDPDDRRRMILTLTERAAPRTELPMKLRLTTWRVCFENSKRLTGRLSLRP